MSKQTRRRFLGVAGIGAAASAVVREATPVGAASAGEPEPPGKRAKKRAFELGLASYTFRKFTLDETIKLTRRVGLEYICLKSFHLPLEASPEDIAKAAAKIRDAGLKLYGGGVITMRNAAEINQAFDYAKAAGMTMIMGVPMPEVLPLVNEKVQQYDIKVGIHNHGPGDKIYPTPESAYEKITKLDKRIGLCIDVGHTFRIGADPIRAVRDYADRLLDVHMKDVTEASPKAEETEVGRGTIDIPALVRMLVKVKFTGVAAFEYEKDENDPLAGLAESVGYVRGVLDAL